MIGLRSVGDSLPGYGVEGLQLQEAEAPVLVLLLLEPAAGPKHHVLKGNKDTHIGLTHDANNQPHTDGGVANTRRQPACQE